MSTSMNGKAASATGAAEDVLLDIRGLRIEGQSDDVWSQIVKGVDVKLVRGRVLGLIGESGAGKSTIGLAAMGFARPGCRITGGEIYFEGTDIRKLSQSEQIRLRGRRIAYVAQSAAAAFNPAHRLIDQVVEASLAHGLMTREEAVARAIELFGRLGLPDPENIGNRYPHQVSGGQLQRIMTAMALAPRPSLVVFDEPTTALDVTTQIDVLVAIKNAIHAEGASALYITHDLAVVAQIADEIMVLRHGRMVELGATDDIISRPKEEYTRDLVGIRQIHKTEGNGLAREPLLFVDGVTAAYGNALTVLHDVTVFLPQAQTLAIVGESGSGKSTMARVITGLLPPRKGVIRFQGQNLPPRLADRSKEQLRVLQMIYQMPDVAINPRQKVREIIGRPLDFYFGLSGRERDARVSELLEQIELGRKFLDRYPAELSGGQKQRVCIARALAAEPRLIICDEPTSALDPLVADGILKLLLRLQAETKVSYLFITHDIATVRAIADSVCVLYRGKVVRFGPKAEVLAPPFDDYTDLLLKSVPEMQVGWLEDVLKTRRMESAGN
ncbi:MAG: ABC transporter ATP-binding protein [Hyphomicrobiaceae bacterium]